MKIIWYLSCGVWFFLSLFFIIAGKVHTIGRFFIVSDEVAKTTNGDLQNDSIPYPVIPIFVPDETDALDASRILISGDSFFQTTLESNTFANELKRKLHVPIHDFGFFIEYPSVLFNMERYDFPQKRVLIYETIEKLSIERTEYFFDKDEKEEALIGLWKWALPESASTEFFSKQIIPKQIFTTDDIEYFFYKNQYTKAIVKLFTQKQSSSSSEPFLFSDEEKKFNANSKDIASAVDIIAKESHELKKYNVDLLYILIPNKWTIYRSPKKGAPDEYAYDDFIPRFQAALTARGVHIVDVYGAYRSYEQAGGTADLYYRTDNHFTPFGKSIVVDATIRALRELNADIIEGSIWKDFFHSAPVRPSSSSLHNSIIIKASTNKDRRMTFCAQRCAGKLNTIECLNQCEQMIQKTFSEKSP